MDKDTVKTSFQNDDKPVHISAHHTLFDLNLREVWQYRELITLFTKRNFQVSYKQTILGPLWLFINPILTAIFQMMLFGRIARLSTDGVPQILFYLSGNAMWSFFSGRVNSNSTTFTGHANLFSKVYFPRLVIPISDVLSGMVRFGIQMILIVVLYLYFFANGMVQPNTALLIVIPLLLLQLGFLGMGIGIIISSMTTKYRDLSVLLGFTIQLWMYATPVVYPLSTVSGTLRKLLLINPVTAPMELFRSALFRTGGIPAGNLCYSVLFTICVMLIGILIFNKVERTFVDTV